MLLKEGVVVTVKPGITVNRETSILLTGVVCHLDSTTCDEQLVLGRALGALPST